VPDGLKHPSILLILLFSQVIMILAFQSFASFAAVNAHGAMCLLP
jgi:hypothetical protein